MQHEQIQIFKNLFLWSSQIMLSIGMCVYVYKLP